MSSVRPEDTISLVTTLEMGQCKIEHNLSSPEDCNQRDESTSPRPERRAHESRAKAVVHQLKKACR